jgi:hypothetical protein
MGEQEVREGQVWADNDRRSRGRTLRVIRVEAEHAVCVVLTDDPHAHRSTVGVSRALRDDGRQDG